MGVHAVHQLEWLHLSGHQVFLGRYLRQTFFLQKLYRPSCTLRPSFEWGKVFWPNNLLYHKIQFPTSNFRWQAFLSLSRPIFWENFYFCKNFIDQVVHFGLLCQCLFQHSTTHVHPKKDIFVKVFASKTIFLPNFDPTKKCLLIYIQNKISNKNNIFGSVTCTITTFVNWKNNHTGNRKHECFFFLSYQGEPACWRQDFLTRPFTFKNFHFIQIYTFTFQSNTFAFKTLYFHFS